MNDEVTKRALAPDQTAQSIRRRRRLALLVILVGIAGMVVLYCVPPRPGGIYPPCLVNLTLGVHCPGCGATRCLHALLHGQIAEAASYNLLLFLTLPVLAFFVMRALFWALVGKRTQLEPVPTWCIISIA